MRLSRLFVFYNAKILQNVQTAKFFTQKIR